MAIKEEERKDDILKAALKVFSKEGFHTARMEDIAITAGIGKGTIYEYFSSKKALFKEMMNYAMEYYISEMHEYIIGISDAKRALQSLLEFNIKFLKEHSEIARMIISQPHEINEDIMSLFMQARHRMEDMVASIIEDGIRCGYFRNVKPLLAAAMFLAAVGRVAAATLYDCGVQEADTADMLDIFFYGIDAR